MIVSLNVSGYVDKPKVSVAEMRDGLLKVRRTIFNKVVEGERENVMRVLVKRFMRLRLEDLEEVYNDSCLVLWEKMITGKVNLEEDSMVRLLIGICKNVGSHYLRKVNEDGECLDRIFERGSLMMGDDENRMGEIFDLVDEDENNEELYDKLEVVWDRLKDVERMILECYYVDGCKMEEISKRIGYKNANSVKSKKNKILKKIIRLMKEDKKEKEEVEK